MATAPPNYTDTAKRHGALSSIAPNLPSGEQFPAELAHVSRSLGVQVVPGKPLPDGGIASVGENEPHRIEINNPQKFARGKTQTLAHEVTHILQNQMPGGLQSKILPDNPKDPYNIDHIDELRAQGHTFATLPREVGATIVQRYAANPADRPRLQKWIDDIPKIPLSIMEPTSPQDKTLNRNVRPPLPPESAYTGIQKLVEEAKKRRPK